MELRFEKWHGCKNDFVVVYPPDDTMVFDAIVNQAVRWCNRDGSGIGADGLLLIENWEKQAHLTIINSDGSVAKTCGNGIRCAARSIAHKIAQSTKFDSIDTIEINLDDETVYCRLLSDQRKYPPTSPMPLVAVTMGQTNVDDNSGFHQKAKNAIDELFPKTFEKVSTCQILNNHLVLFTNSYESCPIEKVGPALQKDPLEDGINVHIAWEKQISADDQSLAKNQLGEEIGELYEIKIWERGAGMTQSCGSGACAVAASVYSDGFIEPHQWIAIDTPGGRLYTKIESSGTAILAGPAQQVYTGTVNI